MTLRKARVTEEGTIQKGSGLLACAWELKSRTNRGVDINLQLAIVNRK